MAPPKNLHDAMLAADEIIIMTNLEWANRFAHVSAVRESCANNVKIASVEGGMGEWDIKVEDILASTDRAVAAIEKLKGVKKCRVWTPEGTDVTVSIEDRPALQVTPIRQRGWMMGPLPLWAEVAYAARRGPDQRRHRGHRQHARHRRGRRQRAHLLARQGRQGASSIEGGRDAKELARVIEGVPNVDVVAEFAFGTSDKSPLGSPSEKGRIGNVHFAMGDNKNAYPGRPELQPAPPRRRACATRPWRSSRAARRLHLPRRASGTSERGVHGVHVVPLEDVPPIDLPGGSWSRVLLTGDRVGSATALGVSASRRAPRPRCCRTRPRSSPTS